MRSVLGRGVSRTKQESQTRVPSFRVKSTLRLESIAAPHFPQTSPGVSLIGCNLFYRTTPNPCFVLPSGSRLPRRRCDGIIGEGVETGVAIVAAVDADMDGAQEIFFDGAATMRTSGFHAAAIWAQASADGGKRRPGSAARLRRGEISLGHSGRSFAKLAHPECRKTRSLVFRKSGEPRRLGK
jgi:hypothetical protein